jgi:CubicO group peptidase (beta-lactamase class C family)
MFTRTLEPPPVETCQADPTGAGTPRPRLFGADGAPAARKRRRLAWLALCAACSVAGAGRPALQVPGPVDPGAVTRAAAALPQLHSLVVTWQGDRVVEYYAQGHGPDRLANVKSVSKSIISTLVGIAIDRKLIPGVTEPVATYFPELRRASEPARRAITIEDLLTMRSGLASTSSRNYGRWVRSRNWVRYVLERPMVSAPGTAMEYSTGTSHLLSAILTRVSGASTWAFAQRELAKPLGFTLARWPRDPQGIYFGGNEMLFTPRQLEAIGLLYLERGRAGDRQVVPATWVDASCVPRTRSRFDPDREYGYGWWIRSFAGQPACFAWGYGGQYILVFRDLSLVIVATASPAVSDERFDHRRRFFSLVEQHVLSPLVAASRGA